MFFFQDNIGYLIQLHFTPFWPWLLIPDAEHFAPITHLLFYIEYHLFNLHFIYYFSVSVILHLLTVALLAYIINFLTKSKFLSLVGIILFSVNLTYTEPILWSLQGLILSTIFVATAFLLWCRFVQKGKNKYFWFSVFMLILGGFTYGLGAGAGIVFFFLTFIYKCSKKRNLFLYETVYILTGILTFLSGPAVVSGMTKQVIPVVNNPFRDFLLYSAFVFSGVTRGVIGRLFLPGFEPRHFQIIPTIISFIPALFILLLAVWFLKNKKIKREAKLLFLSLGVLIIYPYIWAGFVRYQFGLKQALAERYAYPSLFFFCMVLVLIIKALLEDKRISKKIILLIVLLIFTFQNIMLWRNSVIFEKRPKLTKVYFTNLTSILASSEVVLSLPLPSYINQEYTISQLAPLLGEFPNIKFIDPKAGNFCSYSFARELSKPAVYDFYHNQLLDPVVEKVLSLNAIENCRKEMERIKEAKL